jgi:cytochrome c oxidase cbb3-type subunit 2
MSLANLSAAATTSTSRPTGWRGVALIAITYIYFLIFAQFAFLQRLAQLHIANEHLKAVMAAMAFGGILFSLLCPRINVLAAARSRLQLALTVCAAAALLTLLGLNLPAAIAVAFLIGVSLGTVTVTLVTHLRLWIGTTNPLLKVGLGTGIGYLICNFPPLFTASAKAQALTAAILCLAAIVFAAKAETTSDVHDSEAHPVPLLISSHAETLGNMSFLSVLITFTALIWLDSAAFFIIQNTPALKAGTWQGNTHLWINGALHLIAALLSVQLLRRRGLATTLAAALLALAVACLLLHDPQRALLASLFYPIGVSLYSVALVAYPALLSGSSSSAQRGRRAGWMYAIGGWFGSAMGIGMGQNLGHIPPLFVLLAAILILTPSVIKSRRRELLATLAILLTAGAVWELQRSLISDPQAATQVERGRQVYVAEGCINCHSQYVRPNTPDVLMWGPVQSVADLRTQRPPLIGNRRQGPDLSEVAVRRSPLWLRAHFYAPAQISHGSIMPSFAPLFRTQRGDDLIAYIGTLRPPDTHQDIDRLAIERSWHVPASAFSAATPSHGEQLFKQECATCHNSNGATRHQWRNSFHRIPPILTQGPLLNVPIHRGNLQRDSLAQIVKFGISATDMAGHEYLSDADVASLTLYLEQITPQLLTTATNKSHGDIR